MLEFRIVIQHGKARPFSLWTFDNFESCSCKLYEFIQNKKAQVRPEYYVVNDFFKNEYPPFLQDITKYKIECREVTKWNLYEDDNIQKKKSNVIYLFH